MFPNLSRVGHTKKNRHYLVIGPEQVLQILWWVGLSFWGKGARAGRWGVGKGRELARVWGSLTFLGFQCFNN